MDMQRTVRLRLHTDETTAALLAETVRRFTSSFNAVARVGWERGIASGVALHKATYYPERARTGLPAQLTCAARVKATEALKSARALRAKGLQRPEGQRRLPSMPQSDWCPIRYDAHSYRVNLRAGTGSLLTVGGRVSVAFNLDRHNARYADWRVTSADLLRDRRGRWWLHVVVAVPAPILTPTAEVVGVDLGIVHPATDSRGSHYGAKHWRAVEQRTHNLRRALQAQGTRSAKRHLQRMSGRQQRFRRDCDHVLSKRLVRSVQPGATLIFEDLTDIRARVTASKAQRRRLHGWSFAQLQAFVAYKAQAHGVAVGSVDPRYTSQQCSACGHRERKNRPNQASFRCMSCGFTTNADHNASLNIRQEYLSRAAVNRPIVLDTGTPPGAPGTSPPPLGRGR